MADPKPVGPGGDVAASSSFTGANPLAPLWSPSGGCEPSAVSGTVQDWYSHTQGFNGMYQRTQQWRDCNEKLSVSPTVEYNYIDMNLTLWTNDQIIPNTTFSACAQEIQSLTITASGACSSLYGASGFGENGVVFTNGQGMLLRPARKNANGTFNETLGYCTQTLNQTMNKNPGAFSCSGGWDTMDNAKAELAQLVATFPTYCPTFNPILVNI